MPIVADAAVKVGADMSGFAREVKAGGESAVSGLGQKIKGIFSPKNLAVAGVAGGMALAGAITAGLAGAVRALIDIERLNAQTDAVIRSTGGAANVTRQQIEEAAEAAERATTIEREAVQEAQNLLLTFTNIRNRAGEGNDIFDQTTESVLDMSVAMGTDARTAAMQLGKALNDPVKGMSQLGRAGVQFTEEQKELVAQLVETGDLLGAQKVILAELETQFGGSAEAFANTTAGRVQRFQNDVGNMFESIVVGATKVADALGEDPLEGFAMNFGEQGDRVHAMADRMGEDFDALKVRIETRMDETGESFTEAANHIEGEWANTSVELAAETGRMMVGVGDAVSEGLETEVKPEYERVAAEGVSIMSAKAQEFRDAAFQNMVSYAKGLIDGRNEPLVQMEALTQLQEEEWDRGSEIARLYGQLTSTELANGLSSQNPYVRAQAEATRMAIVSQLAFLGEDASLWGYGIAQSMADGLNNGYGVVVNAAGNLAAAVRGQIGIESEPKAHDSPLRGITRWGGNIVKTVADGLYAELGAGSLAAAALAGALVPNFATTGLAMAGAPPIPPQTPVGVGPTYIVNVNGVQRTVKSEEEAMQALRDLGAFDEGRLA